MLALFLPQSSASRFPHHHQTYPRPSNLHSQSGAKPETRSYREGQKVREKEYAYLNAAARAKQEREGPRSRGDSVSLRYSSDPIKFTKEKG